MWQWYRVNNRIVVVKAVEGKQQKCGDGSSFDCRGGENNINIVVLGGGGDCGGGLSGRGKNDN